MLRKVSGWAGKTDSVVALQFERKIRFVCCEPPSYHGRFRKLLRVTGDGDDFLAPSECLYCLPCGKVVITFPVTTAGKGSMCQVSNFIMHCGATPVP